jgi:peptidoglycan/LPS O-acetylase OafA/YrhL
LITDLVGRWLKPPSAGTQKLQECFDPQRNNLTAVRLGLAVTVAVGHAMAVGFGHQPGIAGTDLGDLAVDAFFVLSGFLLAGSYLRLASIRRYAWHRFLRIMPGFWVCLALTAVFVAPIVAWQQGRSATSVFTAGPQSALDYVVANSTLLMRQFGIAGLPEHVPVPDVMDGSLWTLFYEAVCYAGVVVLAVLGGLRSRRPITLLVVGGLWALIALNAVGVHLVGQERILRLAFMFLLGTAMFLYARTIPVRNDVAVASLVLVLAALIWLPDYRMLAAPAFAYLCLWLVVFRPPQRMLQRDLSYGLYVYHWPIEQLLVVAGLTALGAWTFIVISLALAIAAAALSWRLVERPSLRYKNAAWVEGSGRKARTSVEARLSGEVPADS